MAYTVNLNTGTDTSISGVSSLTINRGLPNFGADWRVKGPDKDSSGEMSIINMNSPVPYPETITFSVQKLANVYKGKNIPMTLWYPDSKGTRVYVTHSGTATITSSDDSSYLCAVPWQISTSIVVGDHPAFAVSNIETILERHISDLFETGDTTTARMSALLRAALLPKDM